MDDCKWLQGVIMCVFLEILGVGNYGFNFWYAKNLCVKKFWVEMFWE
jgi:hypothetical protein